MTAGPAAAAGVPWPSSEHYASRARRQAIILAATTLVVALAYALAIIATDGEFLLVVPLVAVFVAIAIIAHPPAGIYLVFGGALLFEQFAISGLAPPTAQSHIFENISEYTPVPIKLSVVDLLMLLTFASWLVRGVAVGREPLRAGPFGKAVAAYTTVFVVGVAIGVSRGGGWDPNAALNELRAPAELCLVYFLATNLIRDRAQLFVLLAEFVGLVGVKALQGISNYLGAQSLGLSLEAVTSHEDVVFFDVAIALMVVVALLGLRTKLTSALMALVPVILTAEVLTQRRVGFIALATVVLAMLMVSATVAPRRVLVLAVVGAIAFGAYAAFFWDESGPVAEPLRAIQTVIDPGAKSARDAGSDHWRDIENRNIASTIRQLPLTGVGVGQQYFFQEEPPPLPASFPYWRYITHNAVLWLWLKAGPLGAFALWFLVARVLLVGSSLYVRLRDPGLRLVAALPVAVVVCQIVFSSVDLGLSYTRTMLVLGTSLGLVAVLVQPKVPSRDGEMAAQR